MLEAALRCCSAGMEDGLEENITDFATIRCINIPPTSPYSRSRHRMSAAKYRRSLGRRVATECDAPSRLSPNNAVFAIDWSEEGIDHGIDLINFLRDGSAIRAWPPHQRGQWTLQARIKPQFKTTGNIHREERAGRRTL